MTTRHDDERDAGWEDRLRAAYQRPLAGEAAARERVLTRLKREARTDGHRGRLVDGFRFSPLAAAASVIAALALGACASSSRGRAGPASTS